MMLSGATDKFQLVTSAAAAVDVTTNYIKSSDSTGAFSGGGPENTAITTATTTDISAAAGASTLKRVKFMCVRNKDASVSVDVTVVYKPAGTGFEIHKATLAPGDVLQYIEGIGFFTITTASRLNKVLRVIADVTNATTAFADITGLTQTLKSGKTYIIEAAIFHINNATTTGSQFGYNIGAAPTLALFGNYSGVTNSVTAGVMALGTATARDTAITAETTGSAGVTETLIQGYIQPSADGTFALRCASEVAVAAGIIVKAGSWMMIRETDN